MLGGVQVPWQVSSLAAQRLEFCRLAVQRDVEFTVLAARFGIAPKTGYKWLARYRTFGPEGLVDRSRIPLSSPSRTLDWVEEAVCELRSQHPAWGGRKIRQVLRRGLDPVVVPAASTVTGILRRSGLLGAVKQPRGYVRFEHDRPNQLWQMDFKGWITTGEGRAEPFDILDDHSRFNLCLQLADQTELTIRRLLHSTFSRYGLPDRILCDNGPPWGNNQPGHRWTGLGVWLIDLGIGVSHSRPFHPQTLGKDERFHRTLDLEVISTRPSWDNHQQLQRAFDRWRTIYNHHRPHDALSGAVPADRYQPSPRTLPTRIDPPEYPDGYQIRKVSTNSQISFAGRIIRIGQAFAGQPVGIIPTTTDGTYQIYYRHQPIRTITIT